MDNFFLKLIIFFCSINVFSQNIEESLDNIEKNILIYKITYSENLNQYKVGFDYLYNLLPNKDEKLNINHIKSTLKLSNYKLYEIYLTNFIYKKMDRDKDENKISKISGKSAISKLSEKYLVGLNLKTKKIIYISGMFFQSEISHLFNLSKKKKDSFYDFLNLKLFNYQMKNIGFKKKNGKYLIFEGYSMKLKSKIIIKVLKKNYDFIYIPSLQEYEY